jgi:hypothetical protein
MGALWWNVEDMLVEVTPRTRVVGAVLPGRLVEVEGVSQADGTILANELRLVAYDLLGTIQAVDAVQMTVDGEIFRLTPQSALEPGLGVGQRAIVRVAIDEMGTPFVVSAVLFAPPTPTAARPLPASAATAAPATAPVPAAPSDEPTEDHSGPGDGEGDESEPTATQEDDEEQEDDEGEEGEEGSEERIDFEGVVESVGGSAWIIGGRTVGVDGETEIEDDPEVGDTVRVRAWLQPDGTWWAERIEIED